MDNYNKWQNQIQNEMFQTERQHWTVYICHKLANAADFKSKKKIMPVNFRIKQKSYFLYCNDTSVQ